ncbi:hypothetical protein RM780_22530 [Streptomyces sp. DSM 44917]|uniref:Uncharacterized protein n=1 Tax=Streptomyces boetiae TaxID=3075541 RepID=A0ABU2LEV8_9ACTN|nr:hypothetical protein [Streptomyces sp. DSM 44917]MDT0309713.1 hypothetical protein [Streptomyces sp. DSM 44917]
MAGAESETPAQQPDEEPGSTPKKVENLDAKWEKLDREIREHLGSLGRGPQA